MKHFFKDWSDWSVVLFFMTLLVLIPPAESFIEKEHPDLSDSQVILVPKSFETLVYHGHEENKQKPELALARPAIVGTASLPSTSFFPAYTMSNPKYGLITSNISLPSTITFGSISA